RREIQRGLDFLVATQKPDGSWPMISRSSPDGSPGSAKLLTPITCAASSWATLGLARLVSNNPPKDDGDAKTTVRQLEITDIADVTPRPFDDSRTRAVVFVFLATDCPISTSYVPELNRLDADYKSRGVRLFLVHADPSFSIEGAREHARQY